MLRAFFRHHPQLVSSKTQRGKARKVAGIGQNAQGNVDYYAMIEADKQLLDGFTKIMSFLDNKANIKVEIKPELVKDVDYAISIRNIITHNRGRMNERFLSRIGNETSDIDIPLIFDQNQSNYYAGQVLSASSLIDKAFIEKYGMEIFAHFMPYPTLSEGVRLGGVQIQSMRLE